MSSPPAPLTDRPTDLSPSEDQIVKILKELKISQPELGVKKLRAYILEKEPNWRLSEKVRVTSPDPVSACSLGMRPYLC